MFGGGEMKIIMIKAVGDGLPIIEESSYYLKFETIPIEFPILQDFGVDMVLKKNSYFDYRAIFLNLKGKEVAAYDFKVSNDKEILRNLEYCVSRFIAEDWNTRSKLKESDLPPQSTDAADVRDNGKPLGYWDDTGRCNRSRRNAQKIGSHRRRAILKLRTHKEIISSYEYRNR